MCFLCQDKLFFYTRKQRSLYLLVFSKSVSRFCPFCPYYGQPKFLEMYLQPSHHHLLHHWLDKLGIKFPWDGHGTAALGINQIVKMIQVKWLIVAQLEGLHSKQTTFAWSIIVSITRGTITFTTWISVKINVITNLTRKLIFRTWSFPMWNNHCYSCVVVFDGAWPFF